ncbi:MAG: hypothetical protein ACRC3Y_01930 [Romboutsia sp.]|uniref:hypothetical protein n=1 Tax=Romboutsia sp. TaxID=1965302 RepID=UPI003F362D8A
MNNLMPYFKILRKHYYMYIAVVLIGVLVGGDGIDLFINLTTNNYTIVDGVVIFSSDMYFGFNLCLFIIGILYADREFNIVMNIRCDRKSYIKAVIVFMLVLGLGISIANEGVTLLIKLIIESASGKDAVVFANFNMSSSVDATRAILEETQSNYLGSATMNAYIRNPNLRYNLINIFTTWLSLTIYSFVGLFIGALCYRLKKFTSVLLFIGLPLTSVLYIVGNFVNNNHLFIDKFNNEFVPRLIVFLSNYQAVFLSNYQAVFLVKTSLGVFCLIGAVLLLRKAPIKEYAHDLI